MAGESRWSYGRLRLWLDLDGVRHPLVSYFDSWSINSVPRAVCSLPAGRSIDTGQPAPVHRQGLDLRRPLPATVWLEVDHRAASDAAARMRLPLGPFVLFKGFTSGIGFATGDGQASVTLSLNHWLVRLTETSCVSPTSHPTNPDDFTLGAVLPATGLTGAVAQPDLVVITKANQLYDGHGIDGAKIYDDIWGNGVLPWLEQLASIDEFFAPGVRGAEVDQPDDSDAQPMEDGMAATLSALKLMRPYITGSYLPAQLRPELSELAHLERLIAQDIISLAQQPSGLAHASLWDIIIGKFLPDFALALVPRIHDALIVPFVPGLNGTPYTVIGADSYQPLMAAAATPRPLRGCGIVHAQPSANDTSRGASQLGIGGLFLVNGPGAVQLAGPPDWLSQLTAPEVWTAEAATNNYTKVRTASSPDAAPPRDAQAGREQEKVLPLLDRLARVRYVEQTLQQRTASISGPLRVDVCPGSYVRLDCAQERHLSAQAGATWPLFGCVLGVSTTIDARAPSAQTSIQLGHVRTLAENSWSGSSVTGHPLYTHAFRGASLNELPQAPPTQET